MTQAAPPPDTRRPPTTRWPGVDVILAGRYRLVEYLATGSVGAVWRAHDEQLDRDVVVKLLLPHRLNDDVARVRFRQEALSTVKAQHPNAVQLFDALTDGEYTFLVMEYVDGPTLAALTGKQIAPTIAAALGAQVAGALGAAHDHGLVHRDVKPGNVLIDRSGWVKVVDFGIAKALASDAHLTSTGAMLGTARYIAPEQMTNDPVGPWTDVYSLALVVWEACVGAPAFGGDTMQATALARIQRTPEPVSDHVDDVPDGLDRILARALHPETSERFRHGRELAEAFLEISGPRPYERTREFVDAQDDGRSG